MFGGAALILSAIFCLAQREFSAKEKPQDDFIKVEMSGILRWLPM